MRKFLIAATLCVLAVGPAAMACTTDAECDNGDTCSEPDTCVLGSCVLGGGGDTDDDLVCDDELDADLNMKATKLVARRKTVTFLDNSATKGRGDLLQGGSVTGAFVGSEGVAIRVKDALSSVPPSGDGVDVSFAWTGTECSVGSTGLTKCKSGDGKSVVKFKPSKLAPNELKFAFKMKGLFNLSGPFFGPVRLVLTRGDKSRSDQVEDCRLTRVGLQCREF